MVDSVRLEVRGGGGGRGLMAFDRGPNRRIGVPSGGDAGRGGHVWVRAEGDRKDLHDVGRRVTGGQGGSGQNTQMTGADGVDCIVRVPLGTLVWDNVTGQLLADLREHGAEIMVAQGGRGGRGNGGRAWRGQGALDGQPGTEASIRLEMRLIADVGLAGPPNVGKSALLYASSMAKPVIAPYAFSTLRPSKGVVQFSDVTSFSMVDLPGLIQGAAQGRGLGHSFLRHVQRTSVICLVLDAAAQDPVGDLRAVKKELTLFDCDMFDTRQLVVVANKMDQVPSAIQGFKALEKELKDSGLRLFPVSAMTKEGLPELLLHLRERVNTVKQRG